ncbi:MAG: sigma-70 family RNA polymerase sigma factor [Lachnospiraceae bacterium]|nr:sigma-70 family RNA polymerase sigma factor [Lachnospiraceae bacterium]
MQLIGSRKKKTNEQIVEEILLEQYEQYYRLAYSYVKNESDAGDVVQNGSYKALRSCHTLRQQEFAKTWVYRIMLNEIYAYLRQPKNDSYEFLQESRGYEAMGVEDEYVNIDLQRALDSLPEQEKVIITMKYFEDKKLEEIADILNENISTVKSRLYRSMKKLQLQMSD